MILNLCLAVMDCVDQEGSEANKVGGGGVGQLLFMSQDWSEGGGGGGVQGRCGYKRDKSNCRHIEFPCKKWGARSESCLWTEIKKRIGLDFPK